jgi:hypothetical protein
MWGPKELPGVPATANSIVTCNAQNVAQYFPTFRFITMNRIKMGRIRKEKERVKNVVNNPADLQAGLQVI